MDDRIGAEHQCIRNLFRHRQRLAIGVELAKFARGQLFVANFRGIARHNAKLQSHFAQQFRAARRRGSENDSRQGHSMIGSSNGAMEYWSAGVSPHREQPWRGQFFMTLSLRCSNSPFVRCRSHSHLQRAPKRVKFSIELSIGQHRRSAVRGDFLHQLDPGFAATVAVEHRHLDGLRQAKHASAALAPLARPPSPAPPRA